MQAYNSPPPAPLPSPPLSPPAPPPPFSFNTNVQATFRYSPPGTRQCSSYSQGELDAFAAQFCEAQLAALMLSPTLLADCVGAAMCVDAPVRRLADTTGIVRITTTVRLTALAPQSAPAAQQEASQLGTSLANPTQAAAIIDPFVAGTATVAQVDVNGNPVPSPSPSPSPLPSPPPPNKSPPLPPKKAPPPPPPKAPRCKLSGVYQLVANGRGACTPSREYLVYYGGNKRLCARNITTARAAGNFKGPRSHWRLEITTGGGATTTLATAGRSCPAGENGMNGLDDPSNTNVFLAQRWHRWEVHPVDSTCANFNIVDGSRAKKGAPAFLSMPTSCTQQRPFLASKDTDSGRQRWTLRTVSARDAEVAARALEAEFAG